MASAACGWTIPRGTPVSHSSLLLKASTSLVDVGTMPSRMAFWAAPLPAAATRSKLATVSTAIPTTSTAILGPSAAATATPLATAARFRAATITSPPAPPASPPGTMRKLHTMTVSSGVTAPPRSAAPDPTGSMCSPPAALFSTPAEAMAWRSTIMAMSATT